MNRLTSIFLAGLIASASALAISLKADAKAPVSYLAELDNYSYHRNDDNYERESRHYRDVNVNYGRENELRNINDNNRRYERENHHRHERENYRRYERENHRRYEHERENNRRYERENHRRYERERDWGRG
ncbi:MAG: hypothetical protein ACYTXA_21780 [Nostoc sp.]